MDGERSLTIDMRGDAGASAGCPRGNALDARGGRVGRGRASLRIAGRPRTVARSGRRVPRPMREGSTGFTLMEVLLVLVILVILGSFAVNIFSGTRNKANIDAAKTQVSLVDNAARLYQVHMNRYPESLDDLLQRPADAANATEWGGPYLQKRVPPDPWGNPYRYLAPGKRSPDAFDVWSLGPDGVDGTEDDIGNWESS